MAQPSVACYFNNRKRSVTENKKINLARKVLVLDNDKLNPVKSDFDQASDKCLPVHLHNDDIEVLDGKLPTKLFAKEESALFSPKIAVSNNLMCSPKPIKKATPRTARIKKIINGANQKSIDEFIGKISRRLVEETTQDESTKPIEGLTDEAVKKQGDEEVGNETQKTCEEETKTTGKAEEITKKSHEGSHSVNREEKGLDLDGIKNKISRSAKLAELKASLSRFKESSRKLTEIEKKTSEIDSPKLKTFKTIQLEVPVSPQKFLSPEKAYLSPRKDTSAKKNLLNLLSPTKNAVALTPSSPSKKILETTSKPGLTLPFKYRYLAEMFRAIDTVCQILYNRKETITFKKLKPAVEEMLKRNLTQKHLAQIKSIFPDAFEYCQEKLRVYGTGRRQEEWELVLKPKIDGSEHMTSERLLERRRKLFNILIETVKEYHNEFLESLIPPMNIPKDKITRWHPEFDIEKLPDIETADLPKPPVEDTYRTGREVLEKAKEMFSCNTRMEQALERLKAVQESKGTQADVKIQEKPVSVLKGIPKALLEKVRQKQAAKALVSMTRSADKEKEVLVYSRLPEIARLTRNIFVTEKKNVLPLETVINKLENCYKCHLTKTEMEEHLKTISKETDGWLSFYDIRHNNYIKVVKNTDLSLIISKLESIAKSKSDSLV